MKNVLFYLFFGLAPFIRAQNSILDDAQNLLENSKYLEIDSYVRNCPNSIEKDLDQLVS